MADNSPNDEFRIGGITGGAKIFPPGARPP
jgi:hypothetical protein